jgi:Ras-related GTP-binding protein C/D
MITLAPVFFQVDGFSDDTKMETQRDIQQRAMDELAENELENKINLSFYLVKKPGTDVMIFEIFSPKNSAKKLAFFNRIKAKF